MVKKFALIMVALCLTGCTWANPNQDSKRTDSDQSAQFQKDDEVTEEELIRYNLYPNPTEYYERENLDRTMENTQETEDNQQQRDIYYELMRLKEVRQAGISITDDKIFVAINLENRSNPKETVQLVKDVVEELTGRSDIIVDVDPDFDTRIE